MMRGLKWATIATVSAVTVVLLSGCSGSTGGAPSSSPNGARPSSPSAASPSSALSLSQLLPRTIVSTAGMGQQGLDPQGDPGEFIATENLSYALVDVCDRPLTSDKQIDGAWQAAWSGTFSSQSVFAAQQMSVHYRPGHGTTAVAQLKATLTCSTYSNRNGSYTLHGLVALTAIPDADAQLSFCTALAETTLHECTAVAAHGSFAAAITVRAATDSAARQGITKIAPLLGPALAAIDLPASAATESTAAPAISTSAIKNIGPWTADVARERFLAMVSIAASSYGPVIIERNLNSGRSDTAELQYLIYAANDYADRLRILAGNLGLGQWPTAANAAIAKLITAATADRTAFLQAGKSTDLATFRTRYAATKIPDAAFASALADARVASGLSASD